MALRKRRVECPMVLQMEAAECGAAALAMVMSYYGAVVPLERLRDECGVSRDGQQGVQPAQGGAQLPLQGAGIPRGGA